MSNAEETRVSNLPARTISNEYYYAQDLLQDFEDDRLKDLPPNKLLNADEQQLKTKKPQKKRKFQDLQGPSSSSSYIIRQGSAVKRGRHLIKIYICELNEQEESEKCEKSENNDISINVSAQYVVDDIYDDVMEAANKVIKRIGERLYEVYI